MRRRHLSLALLILPAGSVAAQDAPTPVAQKICLAPASVEAAPKGSDPLAAVRESFTSFLTGPTLGVTPLQARLESQVRQEAKLTGCAYLLLSTIKHQRKTGGGLLGRAAGGAAEQGAWSVGAGAGSQVGRVAAAAAVGAARTATWDYSHNFRTKDELTLEWRLEGPDGAEVTKGKEKKKAGSDGEDLLTPLVQHASEAIAAAVGGS
ncbi:MAG: hypothetical protein ABIQ49_15605 [Gemmatimonadales bacterium]